MVLSLKNQRITKRSSSSGREIFPQIKLFRDTASKKVRLQKKRPSLLFFCARHRIVFVAFVLGGFLILLVSGVWLGWVLPGINIEKITLPVRDPAKISIENAHRENVFPSLREEFFRGYFLRDGEFLSQVALGNGLKLDTLLSLNKIKSAKSFKKERFISIPVRDGGVYTVKKNETLQELSKRFGVTLDDLVGLNALPTPTIGKGDTLFIAGLELSPEEREKILQGLFTFPANGLVSGFFGSQYNAFLDLNADSKGIEITTGPGVDVTSAKAGIVFAKGFHPSYGNFVIVDHGDNVQTMYSGLKDIVVDKGQRLDRTQTLAFTNSSGASDTTKLRFFIIKNNQFIDPLPLMF